MGTSGPLLNIGELARPASILIEKVCNAVGILYEPTRVRRQAKAEAEAEKVRTLARIELEEIKKRARQKNERKERSKRRAQSLLRRMLTP